MKNYIEIENDFVKSRFEKLVDDLGLERTKKLAKAGDVYSEAILGVCYASGIRVRKNIKTAVRWHERAANQGFPPAQKALGKCYKSGRGVEQNSELAKYWLDKAKSDYGTFSELGLSIGSLRLLHENRIFKVEELLSLTEEEIIALEPKKDMSEIIYLVKMLKNEECKYENEQ